MGHDNDDLHAYDAALRSPAFSGFKAAISDLIRQHDGTRDLKSLMLYINTNYLYDLPDHTCPGGTRSDLASLIEDNGAQIPAILPGCGYVPKNQRHTAALNDAGINAGIGKLAIAALNDPALFDALAAAIALDGKETPPGGMPKDALLSGLQEMRGSLFPNAGEAPQTEAMTSDLKGKYIAQEQPRTIVARTSSPERIITNGGPTR